MFTIMSAASAASSSSSACRRLTSSLRRFCRPLVSILQHPSATNTNNQHNKNNNGSRSITALILDTETSHKADFYKASHDPIQPDLVQLGMILVDVTNDWKRRLQVSLLVNSVSHIDVVAQQVHGISVEDCRRFGVPLNVAAELFQSACAQSDVLVAHNLNFDRIVMEAALYRSSISNSSSSSSSQQETKTATEAASENHTNHEGSFGSDAAPGTSSILSTLPQICTMHASTDVLKLPGKYGNNKWPSLQESYGYFHAGETIQESHDALGDAEACLSVFRRLVERGDVNLTEIIAAHQKKNNNTQDDGAAFTTEDSNEKKKEGRVVDAIVGQKSKAKPVPEMNNNASATLRTSTSSLKQEATVSRPQSTTSVVTNSTTVAKSGELVLTYNEKKNRGGVADGFTISGNTYPYKDSLKALGARWDASQKAWSFADLSNLEPAKRLAGLTVSSSSTMDGDNQTGSNM